VRKLVSDTRWLVRHSAIEALRCSSAPENERLLVDLLAATADPHDIPYAQSTLGKIGSEKSLDAMRVNLRSRKPDIKVSAKLAIEAIEARLQKLATA
jgi:HEAT repeat protein